MKVRRHVATALSVLAAASLLAAQGTPPAQGQATPDAQATFRTRIDSISVDVQVTDKQGKPVTDLTAKDFEIKENSKPQTVDTFKLVQLDESPIDSDSLPPILSIEDMNRAAAKDDARLIVIFLDDYHVMRINGLQVREQVARFVNQLNPRDLVAIMYPLMPVTALTFTRNHTAVARDVLAFEGRKYDYIPRNAYEQQLANQPPELIEQMRNSITISAIETLCGYLKTLREGRKTLMFVSEGLVGATPSAVLGSSGSRSLPSSPSGSLSSSLTMHFQEIFADAARSNTAIYTLDPRGLAVSEFGVTQQGVTPAQDRQILNEGIDSLRILADQTGGRAIVGTNDPMPMLKQMLRDTSAYYLLSYTSTEKARDGRFHPFSVKVLRKDIDVRARKGYWAYSNDDVAKITAPPKLGPSREVATALDGLVDATRGRAVRVWLGAEKTGDGKSAVTLAWEANAGPAAADALGTPDHITATATSVYGDQLFKGTVPRDPQAGGAAGRVTFAAPPGAVSVKFVAETAKGLRLDSDDLDVDVPDFTAVGVFITKPVVFRGRTARDVQQIRAAAAPVPIVTREFLRAERLLIRFQVYGPGGTTPTVTARLLNQLGQSMVDLPPPVATGGAGFEIDMGLGTLAPAEYIIEITADSSGTQKKSLLAIRITG